MDIATKYLLVADYLFLILKLLFIVRHFEVEEWGDSRLIIW